MTMRVERLRTGPGQLRLLEIRSSRGAPYRGVNVLTRNAETGIWGWQYANSPGRRFSTYEGSRDTGPWVWRSISPWRTRESRLVSERLEDGLWRRTMSISTDDGATWKGLWMDELRKVDG